MNSLERVKTSVPSHSGVEAVNLNTSAYSAVSLAENCPFWTFSFVSEHSGLNDNIVGPSWRMRYY